MQRGINRRPIRLVGRLGQKLWHFYLTRSYSGYQPIFDGKRWSSSGKRDCEERWNYIRGQLYKYDVGNLLDVGCGEGYYLIKTAKELGCYSVGIEADYSRFCIAQSQISRFGVRRASVLYDEVSVESVSKLPVFDAVLFLSVAHHMMYSLGEDYCRKFLSCLRQHTRKALLFEMGQSDESHAKWANLLPDMGDNPHERIHKFLLSCGYSEVAEIGESKSYFGDRYRAVFCARP